MMPGIWRLQLLREVARRGTVRAAAAAMSITPSAVRQQLRILEAEAGVPLLPPAVASTLAALGGAPGDAIPVSATVWHRCTGAAASRA